MVRKNTRWQNIDKKNIYFWVGTSEFFFYRRSFYDLKQFLVSVVGVFIFSVRPTEEEIRGPSRDVGFE